MLKACVCLFGHNQDSHKKSGRKEEIAGAPMSYNFPSQSRDFSVRIVHAGGREELYQHKLPASHLMEKYPGMCVARPEVFKNPQQSLLWPDENLLPGHKYLMIPSTTAQKLRHKHVKGKVAGYANGRNEMSDVNITWEASKDISDVSVSSAKDFYTSKGRSSRDAKRSMKRRSVKPKKDFVPPLPKTRIYRGPNWEPSLTSVQELSP